LRSHRFILSSHCSRAQGTGKRKGHAGIAIQKYVIKATA
jgi:hypothetical protein